MAICFFAGQAGRFFWDMRPYGGAAWMTCGLCRHTFLGQFVLYLVALNGRRQTQRRGGKGGVDSQLAVVSGSNDERSGPQTSRDCLGLSFGLLLFYFCRLVAFRPCFRAFVAFRPCFWTLVLERACKRRVKARFPEPVRLLSPLSDRWLRAPQCYIRIYAARKSLSGFPPGYCCLVFAVFAEGLLS